MKLPFPILIVGIISFAILLSTYFFIYKPTHKKIQNLKEYAKKSEKELSEIKLKMKDYKPVSGDERLLWAQNEEQLLTVISNKKHLYLLASEIADRGPFLEIVDISYIPSKVSAANPTTTSVSEQSQTSKESDQAKSAQIDYTLLKMKFYCKYGELLDFLKNLNQLQRLVSIESLNIKKSIPKLLVEITFRTYYWET